MFHARPSLITRTPAVKDRVERAKITHLFLSVALRILAKIHSSLPLNSCPPGPFTG